MVISLAKLFLLIPGANFNFLFLKLILTITIYSPSWLSSQVRQKDGHFPCAVIAALSKAFISFFFLEFGSLAIITLIAA